MSFTFESVKTKIKSGKICLLDADYLKYIAVYQVAQYLKLPPAETNIDFEGQPKVLYFLKSYLYNNIFEHISDPIIFCFSGSTSQTFRSYVSFERQYKGKRSKEESYENEHQDMLLVVEYMIKNYTTLFFEDLEADDIISCLHDENTYIFSKDKDLHQLPGTHYDMKQNSLYEIGVKDAGFNLCYQLIVGDVTDNICGIKGYGDKKAREYLLKYKPSEWIYRVLTLYVETYGTLTGFDYFTENWMLVKLRLNRGEYFKEQKQKMFVLKQLLLDQIKK